MVFLLPSHYVQLAAAAAAGGQPPFLDADVKPSQAAEPSPVRETVLKETLRESARESDDSDLKDVKDVVKTEPPPSPPPVHRGKLRHHRKASVQQEPEDLVVPKSPASPAVNGVGVKDEVKGEDVKQEGAPNEEADDAPLDFTTGERKIRVDRPRPPKREAPSPTGPSARDVRLKVPRPWTRPGPEDDGQPVYDDDGNVWRPW